jgi:hypothetical protein
MCINSFIYNIGTDKGSFLERVLLHEMFSSTWLNYKFTDRNKNRIQNFKYEMPKSNSQKA